MRRNRCDKYFLCLTILAFVLVVSGCSNRTAKGPGKNNNDNALSKNQSDSFETIPQSSVINKEYLDSYKPQKTDYNFYFTYKIVHSWWDAVALGMEDAVRQYEEKGIHITYDYRAPEEMSALDQVQRIRKAAALKEYDVLGVDVADIDIVTPVINQIIAQGHKVMTFSSSDSGKENGCNRIAYVGNTHNMEDGEDLAEALCQYLNFKGKVAMLVGNEGAPCHEDRAKGARKVFAKYPGIELVDVKYDEDNDVKAYNFTKDFLAAYPDLNGIICCNMSNSVGAGRAVEEAGKAGKVIIVGMDHDELALKYMRDGIIYALAIQDCYSIGFDTITTAVKIADGVLPGSLYPEKTEEITTVFYQKDAAGLLRSLYGVID
ncbi:MAG: substrate-binding domain-containing protein [Spirochaetaceae bacterium]|nr:substrate-binding domain-containing protein [Spirochaetaceae bacterium]